jgi:hypothetical protein
MCKVAMLKSNGDEPQFVDRFPISIATKLSLQRAFIEFVKSLSVFLVSNMAKHFSVSTLS